jgi:hypothetical protein
VSYDRPGGRRNVPPPTCTCPEHRISDLANDHPIRLAQLSEGRCPECAAPLTPAPLPDQFTHTLNTLFDEHATITPGWCPCCGRGWTINHHWITRYFPHKPIPQEDPYNGIYNGIYEATRITAQPPTQARYSPTP